MVALRVCIIHSSSYRARQPPRGNVCIITDLMGPEMLSLLMGRRVCGSGLRLSAIKAPSAAKLGLPRPPPGARRRRPQRLLRRGEEQMASVPAHFGDDWFWCVESIAWTLLTSGREALHMRAQALHMRAQVLRTKARALHTRARALHMRARVLCRSRRTW